MKLMRLKKLIVGVAVLAAPAFAMAQSAEQLIEKYTPLVVTAANATALVNGLRNGTEVVMLMEVSAPPPPPPPPPLFGLPFFAPTPMTVSVAATFVEVKFTPRTGKMGFGNVDNALTLAQGSLKNLDIVAGTPNAYQRQATPEDVKFALMGGEVKTPRDTLILLPGILELRYLGNGWGEIAQQVGAKL